MEKARTMIFHCLSELRSSYYFFLVAMMAFAQVFQRNDMLWQGMKEWFLCEISGMGCLFFLLLVVLICSLCKFLWHKNLLFAFFLFKI